MTDDSDKPTYLPTHTCFDDAADLIENELRLGNRRVLLVAQIVHGICLAPDGTPYSHAWVEDAMGMVEAFIDPEGKRVWVHCPREVFEQRLRPQRVVKYSLHEWSELNALTNHYGPWDPEIKALCANGDRRVWKADK